MSGDHEPLMAPESCCYFIAALNWYSSANMPDLFSIHAKAIQSI